ncbi:tryptophan 7-halogenase [Sphingomonas piscis]|uniref:Tryptophan 7-halogenase n=1 Tax=Sphingomonas piscis TaxID=2714943 RepID=A0A6G7YN44_9SPHN|nr:tryptophan 7-halogenase [Sphingomonas piscis]QIK78165.1 tryptophan 7-halogenase [Sphingomonas piscis]
MNAPPRNVVVVGRDAELWLAAAAIRRALAMSDVSVDAVQLPSKLPAWAVVPTLPPIEALHRRIGIDERELIAATGGSFSLGWQFGQSGDGFFHAWASYGHAIAGQDFLPCWLRASRFGLRLPFQDFSLSAVAARTCRLMRPDSETARFGRTDFAYQLPAHLYAALVKRHALALGVIGHNAADLDVERTQHGNVKAVCLPGGARLGADLYVDATGTDALLIGPSRAEEPEAGLVDRLLTSHAPRLKRLPPFASVVPSSGGWTLLLPTQTGTHVAHAFSSECESDEHAVRAASNAAQFDLREISITPLIQRTTGPHWAGNVVAIGAAAASLDPLHGAGLHLAQLGIVHLLNLFPVSADHHAEQDEFNRVMSESVARIRDFQDAYYKLSSNKGSLWSRARSRSVSPDLEHRIATFMARGEVAPLEHESFSHDSWRALFIGLRVLPESWPPSVDHVPVETLQAEIGGMVEFIRAKVLQQMDHGAHLQRLAHASS